MSRAFGGGGMDEVTIWGCWPGGKCGEETLTVLAWQLGDGALGLGEKIVSSAAALWAT
jgi:hypothetical protein